jgi:hypothetical protein
MEALAMFNLNRFYIAACISLALISNAPAQVNNPGAQFSGSLAFNDCLKYGPGVGQIQSTGGACAAPFTGVVGGTSPSSTCTNGNILFNNAGILACSYSFTGLTLVTPVINGIPTGTGVSSSGGFGAASTLILRDTNGYAFSSNFVSNQNNRISGGNTFTMLPSSVRLQRLTGISNETYVLPDATVLIIGTIFEFDNDSTGNLIIQDHGANVLATVPGGGSAYVSAAAVSTVNGSWDIHYFLPSNVSWGTAGLPISNLASEAANTVLGNWTGGAAVPLANTMPSCADTTGNHLNYVNGTGITCGTSVPASVASLTTADQTLSGGANVTAGNLGTKSSGTTTIDCGTVPLQYLVNGGAFILAAPAADGSCMVLVTNNASAGAITLSGFTVGTSTGAALTTTNTNKFTISIWRINGTAGYTIFAHQ